MALADLSYGASLPDSIPLVSAHASSLVDLLPTLASYLSHRASLEREYSTKLSALLGKARQQANIDTPSRGGSDSTLEKAWAKFLEEQDLAARESATIADKMEKEVVTRLESVGARLEKGRKKHDVYAAKLLSERDNVFQAREKSRAAYFSACETLEAARAKQASGKESKSDKLERVYNTAFDEMGIAKDRFLIDTQLANAANKRLYQIDLPATHDDFQILEKISIRSFVGSLETLIAIEKDGLATRTCSVQNAEAAVKSISIDQDQQRFLLAYSASKLATFELPPELSWEECPTWHDTSEFSTTPPSTNYLLNVKIKNEARLGELDGLIGGKKREKEGLNNLAEAYSKDSKLGDAASVLENLFEATRESTFLSIEQSSLTNESSIIDTILGDASSISLKPHAFKSTSFVTPQPCPVCHSSIWGKGLSCRSCSTCVHAKCELKAPAGCGSTSGIVTRSSSSRKPTSSIGGTPRTIASASSSTIATGAGDEGPPRRTLPPAFGTSSTTSMLPPSINDAPTETSATMVYAYEAQTSFELTVSEGEIVSVVQPEDEAGWVKVRCGDGRVGLVPGSYLQLGGKEPVRSDNVATGERATALYSYDAAGPDELSFVEGDVLELTAIGRAAGEGWAEAIKEGKVGLVPLSYIEA